MNPFINAQGYAIIGMLSVTVGAVANIILDPIFIFVLDMGIKGAAIATVISQILSALLVFYFLHGKSELKVRWIHIMRFLSAPDMPGISSVWGLPDLSCS